jgi:type I restriction-modification system DNA methylase subunit
MLFVKYVSDSWTEHYEQLQVQYGDDRERILRRLERERFVLPPDCRFDDVYTKRNDTNLGEVINKALEQIEEANKLKLAGVFRNIDFNSEANLGQARERNTRLKMLLEDFAKIVAAYTQRETIEKYAYLAGFDEIQENDFNLNILRYVDTFEEEAEIDIGAVQAEIDGLEEELSKVKFRMVGYLEELGL